MCPQRAIVIAACSLASLSGMAGCKKRPAQAPVESDSKPHSASRSQRAGSKYLPASTIVAIRERLPGAGQSAQSRIPGVGGMLKSLLFPMLEIDRRGAMSASLRPGGELLAVVWADRAALRRRLVSGQNRLRSAPVSSVPLTALYRGLPAVLVQAQLTLPVRDSKAFLKHLHRLKLLKGPTVTRWMRGEMGATAVPPELAPLAEMKPGLMARERSAGWIAACWQRPTRRQVFCRVAYPLGVIGSGSSLAKALVKQWQSTEPSTSARSRSHFYGKEQLAVFVDAGGIALVSDVASLPEVRRLLEQAPPKQRRSLGQALAGYAAMASALIDSGSQLITYYTMVLERDGSDIISTARWPLTKRGHAVLAPIVQKARG